MLWKSSLTAPRERLAPLYTFESIISLASFCRLFCNLEIFYFEVSVSWVGDLSGAAIAKSLLDTCLL
jgi:hypothetical protein